MYKCWDLEHRNRLATFKSHIPEVRKVKCVSFAAGASRLDGLLPTQPLCGRLRNHRQRHPERTARWRTRAFGGTRTTTSMRRGWWTIPGRGRMSWSSIGDLTRSTTIASTGCRWRRRRHASTWTSLATGTCFRCRRLSLRGPPF